MTDDELITNPGQTSSVKKMKLRYAGICSSCATAQAAGDPAMYDRVRKSVMCIPCASASTATSKQSPAIPAVAIAPVLAGPAPARPLDSPPPAVGTAGASALREYERRKQLREGRIRDAHPRLGKIILAVTDEPTSTRVWRTGAIGEQQLGRTLDALEGAGVLVLHDRRIPGSRANIDHLAVGPGGVFVLDAKRYRGKRPERRVEGGLLRPRVEKLFIGGRDRSALLDGVAKQVDLVRAALAKGDSAAIGVRGVLCFLDADWPLIGGSFRVRGFDVLWPRLVQKLVGATGTLEPAGVVALHRLLANAFPPA